MKKCGSKDETSTFENFWVMEKIMIPTFSISSKLFSKDFFYQIVKELWIIQKFSSVM